MRGRYALLLGAAIAGRAGYAAAQHDSSRGNVPLTRLREGSSAFTSYSGLADSALLVVRDSSAWQELWQRVNRPFIPAPPVPTIDFQQEMIVVAALGRRPTAGHDVVIEGAEQDSAGIQILVRRSEPAPGCPVAAAVTQPVDLARMRADRRAVRFRERQVVVPCSRP
ncbi:MAG TPA: protease complex subunit PrcB family protein [Gemmatimonadaceae bacterium]